MELPDRIKTVGEQLEAGGEITPAPELFEAYRRFSPPNSRKLFVAPVAGGRPCQPARCRRRLFPRRYRQPLGRAWCARRPTEIHALRNACLHAGYRVCEEEGGRGDHLFCQLSRLVLRARRPPDRPDAAARRARPLALSPAALRDADRTRADPRRPVDGGAGAAAAGPVDLGAVPGSARPRQGDRPQALSDDTAIGNTCGSCCGRRPIWCLPAAAATTSIEFGPLSFVALRGDEAALVRLIPRYPGHSDFESCASHRRDAPAAGRERRRPDRGSAARSTAMRSPAAPLGCSIARFLSNGTGSALSAAASAQ